MTFTVTVWNLSPIVDAYRIEAANPPGWLDVSSAEVRLLPTTSGQERITARIRSGSVALAGLTRLRLAVRSVAYPQVFLEVDLDLTVPASDVPVTLRLEPSVVKVKDATSGRLQVLVDNVAGNRPRVLRLSGRDPEGVTRFDFAPPVLDVPPGRVASATLTVTAPLPEPGQQSSRQLTVSARDEDGTVDAIASFQQSSSVDVPLAVRVEPTLVRVRDAGSASMEAVLDNRKGSRTRRVFLSGRDPERVARFTFAPPSVDVFPGETVRARVRVQAPQPDPGAEATRNLTIVASQEGAAEVEATATLVQSTSAIPVQAPVVVKLEPSLVRVQDGPTANVHVIIDNRRGTTPRRVAMSGTDPEKAISFAFWPQVVEVGAGQLARTNLRLDAPPPRPGAEASRQFTILAVDGDREQEVAGTFVQVTSPPPPDEPMTVRLEPPGGTRPQQLDRPRSRWSPTTVAVGGTARSRCPGYDAGGVVRFSFVPAGAADPAGSMGIGVRAHLGAAARTRRAGEPVDHRGGQSTASGTRRRLAASCRRAATAVRCGGCCSRCSAAALMIIGSMLPSSPGTRSASLGVGRQRGDRAGVDAAGDRRGFGRHRRDRLPRSAGRGRSVPVRRHWR